MTMRLKPQMTVTTKVMLATVVKAGIRTRKTRNKKEAKTRVATLATRVTSYHCVVLAHSVMNSRQRSVSLEQSASSNTTSANI